MKTSVACSFVFALSACSGPYSDLEKTYAASVAPSGTVLTTPVVVLTSPRHEGAYSIRGILSVSLTPEYVAFTAAAPYSYLYKSLKIPVAAISGCSTKCFGPGEFDADILLGKDKIQLSIEKSEEVFEWCWTVGLPMISGKEQREWMYKGGELPDRAAYVQVSKEEYSRQRKSRCMGI